jgi:hypothetical protein
MERIRTLIETATDIVLSVEGSIQVVITVLDALNPELTELLDKVSFVTIVGAAADLVDASADEVGTSTSGMDASAVTALALKAT